MQFLLSLTIFIKLVGKRIEKIILTYNYIYKGDRIFWYTYFYTHFYSYN